MENVTVEVVQRIRMLLCEEVIKRPIQFYFGIQNEIGEGLKLLQIFIIEEGMKAGASNEKIAEVASQHSGTLWILGIYKLFHAE